MIILVGTGTGLGVGTMSCTQVPAFEILSLILGLKRSNFNRILMSILAFNHARLQHLVYNTWKRFSWPYLSFAFNILMSL